MGFFNVACSLTGTPILTGDKCYQIVVRKDFKTKDFFYFCEGWKWDVKHVLYGEYDDYGGIEGSEIKVEVDEPNFFICKKAWDWCQKRYPDSKVLQEEKKTYELIGKEFPEWAFALRKVLMAFHNTFKSPFAGYTWGSQYIELNELKALHREVTTPRIRQLEKKYKEWAAAD